MSVDTIRDKGRGGGLRRNKLDKWDLNSAVAEDFLEYIDDYEANTSSVDIPTTETINKSLAVTRDFGNRYPACEMCSTEY